MAEKKPASKVAAPAGGKIKKHVTSVRHENYEAGKQKNKFCPKCGPGIMLANHKDRRYCGKCHYMETI